ncbi:PIN domain-containing protein [Flavobacterium luteolum]|uniref:PIN domain-containing protein n=1 Tax=Flavobacterium luteolum TaxID=3003259 RepID=UPI00248E8E23|nr:hypothetical protein [Flavobacterium luteolum]
MGDKNVNKGTIISEGEAHIGDKYVSNIFLGLSHLLSEFREQLRNIEDLTNQFKIRTALGLLEKLENRVKEHNEPEKDKILSKISYLKGACKRELSEFSNENVAMDFVAAYSLNNNDAVLRDRACVEYLNIDLKEKAVALADDILTEEEFNTAAWYVKATTAEDFAAFLPTIPKVVREEYNFQLALVQHVVQTAKLYSLAELQQYGLTLNLDFSKYKELTFSAVEAWRLAADLAVTKVFSQQPIRYISGEKFSAPDNPLIMDSAALLQKYVDKLQDTEIKDSILHEQFFLGYFRYLLTNDKENLELLKKVFPKIDEKLWTYAFCYCQVLNHNKEYHAALKCLDDYEAAGNDLNSEFYIFKSALYKLTGRSSEIIDVFGSYLDTVDIIEEKAGLNILSSFANILLNIESDDLLQAQLEKIKAKDFKNDELKALLSITFSTRYLEIKEPEKIYEELIQVKDFPNFDSQWKSLIAENLNALGKRKEAIEFLNSFVDKTAINPHLRFYIILLYDQLHDRNDQETGHYMELLELLKFWRITAKAPDQQLLNCEHNLYAEINDLQELEAIDGYLYECFPNNEDYILEYVARLERSGNINRIKEIAEKITWEIENENFGVTLAVILLRTEADPEKGFKILYNLASNPQNTIARRNYIGSHVFIRQDQFLISYDKVEIGSWVTYLIGEKKMHQKIERDFGTQGMFIGRKPGEEFTAPSGVSNKLHNIKILEILNDGMKLFRDIQDEAANPLNELGFESIEVPTDPKELLDFLKSEFGEEGTKNAEIKEKALDDYYNYRTGFTEVTRAVFRSNYIDAYMHLTANKGGKFTTVPSALARPLDINDNKIIYVLDFSSLMLFFALEKKQGFAFKHNFAVSFYLKDKLEKEIYELKNSPASSMTLQITPELVRKFETPEDFSQKKILFLASLLEWIEKNCTVDHVAEKLNTLPKLSNDDRFTGVMKVLTDYIYLAQRENHRVISSDTTLFMHARVEKYAGAIVNPEKYLLQFYPEKCGTEFYKFLLQSNYIGINITLDTLKEEFFRYLGGGENQYNLCLDNLTYTTHDNPKIVVTVSKFLKEIYTIPSIPIDKKNRYAGTVFSRVLYGMPKEVVIDLSRQLNADFKLLGALQTNVFAVFASFFQQPPPKQ